MSGLLPSRRLGVLLLALVLARPAELRAEVAAERLEQAKALFREGNALLGAGDPERALERFLASRAAVASGKNTANAAICLQRLGRHDEALELYEELLSRFSADIDDQDREDLVPIMARLRSGLGSLDVSANVEALVTIDGKPRGQLPRATALRALPGKRRVRVVKEGYQTFDVVVDVRAGESAIVDASLEPLSGLGALRVEQTGSGAVSLFVDGKRVGRLPWEGTLRAGFHLLQASGGNLGSKPQAVQVIERKTQLIRVSVRALGAPIRVATTPATSALLLDDVPLGRGAWSGRLPFGSYVLHAQEPGYFARAEPLVVSATSPSTALRLDLPRDPHSTRWPQRGPFRYRVGIEAGFVYAPTLNGDQEALCPAHCQGGRATNGGRFEASLEVLHELGLGAELGLGYLLARQSFRRAAFDSSSAVKVAYALEQQLVIGGGYARVAGVARQQLPRGFTLRSTLGAGLVAASFEAQASGIAGTVGTEVAPAAVFGYEPISELLPVVTTGMRLERALGAFELSLGLDAWFVPRRGPRFGTARLLLVQPSCPDSTKTQSVGCAAGPSKLPSKERIHGMFALASPALAVRYRF